VGAISPIDVVSVAIASVALTLAIGSLVLQYLTWRRGGPLVTVSIAYAYMTAGPLRVISITARNRGADVLITSFWLDPGQDQKKLYVPVPVSGSATLPAVLKSGHELAWHVELEQIQRAGAEHGFSHVRGCVALATGETSASPRRKRLRL
jgi:hypothetical protein